MYSVAGRQAPIRRSQSTDRTAQMSASICLRKKNDLMRLRKNIL